jgi:hypothetical protein
LSALKCQATLYYTFAALQGYTPAEMALGYRHWAGIGVKEVSSSIRSWDLMPGGDEMFCIQWLERGLME